MSFTFDSTVPATGHNPSVDYSTMQQNNVSTAGIIAVDHVGFNVAGGGQHEQVTFNINQMPPGFGSGVSALFSNTVSSLSQLFFQNSSGTIQITGPVTASSNGSAFLPGGIILKWGSFNPGGASGNEPVTFSTPFPNNLFVALPVGGKANTGNISFVCVNTAVTFDKTQFGVTYQSPNSTPFTNIYWIAIGN